MLQVKKDKRGIDNILGLLRYTFPKVTRVVTPSHITVASRPIGDPPGDHNMELTVTGISETTTGEVVLPYQAFDLTNCDCPSEIAAEMFSLTQVKAFLATKPIAIDELDFAKEGDAYRVTATEGAFTVFGEKVFTLVEEPVDPDEGDGSEPEDPEGGEEEDPEDPEPEPEPEPEDPEEDEDGSGDDVGPGFGEYLILHGKGPVVFNAPIGTILYSTDEGETWKENTSVDFTVSIPSGPEAVIYLKSNDNVELTKPLTVRDQSYNTWNFIGIESWWESSRPIRINVKDNSFYVPKIAPPNITDMTRMFFNSDSFNSDISNWDVSGVTAMEHMFSSNSSFNQDLSNWDVSNVTTMQAMFYMASSFNSDISNWDVSSVTNMWSVFSNASSFNQDISNWDVSNATNMTSMFQSATNFNQDLSSWCVSNFPSNPNNFDYNATAWTLPRPVWGTCPPR